MTIELVSNAAEIRQAAEIAEASHRRLRGNLSWLPPHTIEEFTARIEWMVREGSVYALYDAKVINAFLGWFRLDNFRNLGAGALTPDWCSGVRDGLDVTKSITPLVRKLLDDLCSDSLGVHAIGLPAASTELLEEFSLLGWGRIVLDAARPATELLDELPPTSDAVNKKGGSLIVRPAKGSDASALALLDTSLAAHIAAAPVLMPDTHGSSVEEWEEWLGRSDTLTFAAEISGTIIGFIKAAPPQFDVSWFVHGASTLAICGLWVNPDFRGINAGSNLLGALVRAGIEKNFILVSVDCETHNPEARAFWLSRFRPVSWSLERRF